MMKRLKSLFTKRAAVALASICVIAAAAAGWKLGSNEAIGRYLTAPIADKMIEGNVIAVGAFREGAYGRHPRVSNAR